MILLSMSSRNSRLLLGVEDTAEVNQQRTKGQKNEKLKENSRFVGRFSFVMSIGSSIPRRNLTQWIERPPSVREVMGSIPVGDSHFLFVPLPCHVDQFTFHIIFFTEIKSHYFYTPYSKMAAILVFY